MKTPAATAAPAGGVERALAHLAEHRQSFVEYLCGLCRVAGISSEWPTTNDMRISAMLVAALADQLGLEHAQVREIEGAHPYVTADWLHAPGAPTVLLYSHHDVQLFGDAAQWVTGPTDPTVRDGRLYARGAVDDKGGIAAQLGAISSYLGAGLPLPCNVRMLVDGEEEVGSPHLGAFLNAYPEVATADAVVVLDTPNLAAGTPALTCSLRGNTIVDVEVRCLAAAVHSGRGGGLVPDPIQILCTLLHRLHGNGGRLAVPGLLPKVARSRGSRVRAFANLPFDAASFRREIGLADGVRFAGDPSVAPLERLWARPALTVIAFEAPHLNKAGNQIVPSARARLSLRTVPDMGPADAGAALVRALTADPPFGAEVRASVHRAVPCWNTDPASPAHRVALAALEKGYGRPATPMGAGGSIGFMSAITRALPNAPCLLLGLEDPDCKAHAPNESLHLGDWECATRSLIHLLNDLSLQPGETHP